MLTTLANGVGRAAQTKTDADGRYAFVDIGDGIYVLNAGAFDYLPGCYAVPETPDRCGGVVVARDQRRLDINISLTKSAAAAGRVVDQGGAPVVGATVRLGLGGPGLSNPMARAMSASVPTRADGTFELRGVRPGEWHLELEIPRPRGSMRLPLIFYPGVFNEDLATRVSFLAGRTTAGLEFVVPTAVDNVLTVRVAPGPIAPADVRAVMIRHAPLVTRSIELNDENFGTVTGLVEGRYYISARGWIKEKAWTAFEITDFTGPSQEVSLQMRRSGSIAGKIVARNGGLPPLDGVAVAAAWVDDELEINPLAPDQVTVEADGSFRIEGLFGKRSIQLRGVSPEWRVYSVLHGRSEVTSAVDVPLDTAVDITIVLARR
jgi:hypothetical protein